MSSETVTFADIAEGDTIEILGTKVVVTRLKMVDASWVDIVDPNRARLRIYYTTVADGRQLFYTVPVPARMAAVVRYLP